MQACHDGFDGIAKFVDEGFFQVCRGVRSQRTLMRNLISPQERCFSPLDVETIDQLLTLEVLPSGLCDVSSDREGPLEYEFGECVW